MVRTARTVAYDILREILREARQFNPREYRVIASPQVIELFLDEEEPAPCGAVGLHRQADLAAGRAAMARSSTTSSSSSAVHGS